MSEGLESLAIWTKNLIRASFDYREHCCEFSKFLVQNVPDDYWPDVAAQLILLLEDIDYMNTKCVKLLEPVKVDLVQAVACLNLPKPEGHLSWTIWTIDHWLQLGWLAKLGLQSQVSAIPNDSQQWFHQMSIQVRREPTKCKDIARHLFLLADRFDEFDDQIRLINLVRAECLGSHVLGQKGVSAGETTLEQEGEPGISESSLASQAILDTKTAVALETVFTSKFANDRPIRWEDIEELCVGKFNRVGKLVAKSGNTVRGWQYAKGWPDPMTWQSVRKWVNEKKSYDFKDPPEEC